MNNNIEEAYCSFEVSKLLKEKGFLILKDGEHPTFYFEGFKRIMKFHRDLWEKYGHKEYLNLPIVQKINQQLAIDWIRVNWGIHIWCEPVFVEGAKSPYKYEWFVLKEGEEITFLPKTLPSHAPEEAKDAAIEYTLKKLIHA